MAESADSTGVSCGVVRGEKVGQGLFVAGFYRALLFCIGQNALGRRGADDGAGAGLGGPDFREGLFLRSCHETYFQNVLRRRMVSARII